MTALQFTVQRYWLNFKRHRTFALLVTIVLAVIVFVFGIIYPGPEFFETILEIPVFQALIGSRPDVDNPGLLFWFLILFSIFTNIIYPVIGIFFGARILPWGERDGKELIFSTEKSPLRYFLENLLLVIVLIPLVMLPAYLVGVGLLLSGGGGVSSFTIAFILPLFYVLVVVMVKSLGCAFSSSTRTGYALGGLIFIISFTLNFLQLEIDSFIVSLNLPVNVSIKDINLMSQIGSFEHALALTWNQEFILKCLIVVTLLTFLTIFFLYRIDHIRTRSTFQEETVREETDSGIRKIMVQFSIIRKFVRTPVESILSRTGWSYPAFRDQLQSLAGTFLIYVVITSMLLALVVIVYPGDAAMESVFSDLDIVFESPIIAAFLFGHELQATLAGFLMYKILAFHWIYYAPFLFIATNAILLRDKNAGYDEITWSMPRARTRVILERTIAALVYLWIIFFVNFVVLYSSEILLGIYADVVVSDFGATVLTFIFFAFGYSIFLVLFVALASIPRAKYISIALLSVFLLAVFIPMVSFLNEDLSWLLYLTPFYYFDVAGIFMQDVLFEKIIPEIIVFGAIIIAFFVFVTTKWIPTRDIA
jgi:ABC-2 type transport system permease protein